MPVPCRRDPDIYIALKAVVWFPFLSRIFSIIPLPCVEPRCHVRQLLPLGPSQLSVPMRFRNQGHFFPWPEESPSLSFPGMCITCFLRTVVGGKRKHTASGSAPKNGLSDAQHKLFTSGGSVIQRGEGTLYGGLGFPGINFKHGVGAAGCYTQERGPTGL